MMMTHELFLEALAAFLRGQTLSDRELNPQQWSQLLALARAHHALPMVYEAVYPLPGVPAPAKGETIQTVMAQTVKTGELLRLYRFLTDRGLTPMVVKGIVCRRLYPKPDHRFSADEDLLIPEGQFDACRQALEDFGMVQAGDCNSYEVPFRMPGSPLYIELHRSLFPPESAAYGDLNRFFEHIHENAVVLEVDGTQLRTMEPGDHLFYLILHAFKHFLHSGFGLRQVCDIVLFAKAHPEIDCEELYRRCKSVHAHKFAAALFAIGRNHLGVETGLSRSWRKRRVDEQPMLRDLLEGGIYGGATASRKHSSTMTLTAVSAEKQGKSPKNGVLKSLFPSASNLEGRYPWLKKQPYLLPVAWGIRIAKYHAESRGDLTAAVAVGKERIELLKYYGIIPEGKS